MCLVWYHSKVLLLCYSQGNESIGVHLNEWCQKQCSCSAPHDGRLCQAGMLPFWLGCPYLWLCINLVDPASSHMLVSKIKPCMSQYKLQHGKTVNGSLKQL